MEASPSTACLDQKFHKVVHAIEQRLQLLDRLPRVRITAWLKKLREEVSSNATWCRNRNAYAQLLLEQLRAGCLEVPFNTGPPQGALPTLPAYLTYRFASSPKQQQQQHQLSACDSLTLNEQLDGSSPPALQPLPSTGAHSSWRLMPAMSPARGGSPPSTRNVSMMQQQWFDGSPKSVRSTAGRRSHSSVSPQHQQRPRSPGAAGLVDAAAAVAAELEAEREQAARISTRLRFAEDRLLQQEAELVRLQGGATSARRRIKSATAATLQELLERYGSAAAWGSQSSPRAGTAGAGGSSRSSPAAAAADAVYRPVWQLLSGLQSVLDSCDQEEQEWLRAKGTAAAAALQACYEAHNTTAPAGALAASDQQQQQSKAVGQVASEGAAAAAAEAAVLQHSEQCLQELHARAEELAAALAAKKEEATAAAGGRGELGAAAVAEGTARLLKPMIKLLRHEVKDASKLRRRLEAAAVATDAAAATASAVAAAAAEALRRLQAALLRDSSSSGGDDDDDDGGSSSSSASGDDSSSRHGRKHHHTKGSSSSGSKKTRQRLAQQQSVLAAAQQQQQLQSARLSRLQSASGVLVELDKASAKLETQMAEAQQRLLDLAAGSTASGGSPALLLPLQQQHHHDNGMLAASTAGIAASLSAGARAFQSTAGNLCRVMQSLRSAAGAAAAAVGAASEGGGCSSSSGSPGSSRLLGRSPSSRLGDAALAGTWGVQHTSTSPNTSSYVTPNGLMSATAAAGGTSSRPLLSVTSSGRAADTPSPYAYDAATHYNIGAAAAGTHSGSSSPWVSGKAAFTGQGLQGSFSSNTGAAAAGSDAAAEAVHVQLAGLSRQASRLSVRANQILTGGAGAAAAEAEGAAGAAGAAAGVGSMLRGSGSFGSGGLQQHSRSPPFTAGPAGAATSPTSSSPFSAAAGAAGVAAIGSGSLLSPAVRSALLAKPAGLGGVGTTAAGGGGLRAVGQSSSLLAAGKAGSLLMQGGRGSINSSISSVSGFSSQFGAGRLLGVGGVGGVGGLSPGGAGSIGSIAAISSRLQGLGGGSPGRSV